MNRPIGARRSATSTGRPYVPDVGDLVYVDFDPQAGREQAGHRPALVLTPAAYNARSSLMVTCPVTSKVKGYPFEVALSGTATIIGVVLADHVRSVDWVARKIKFIEKADDATVGLVRAKLAALLGIA